MRVASFRGELYLAQQLYFDALVLHLLPRNICNFHLQVRGISCAAAQLIVYWIEKSQRF